MSIKLYPTLIDIWSKRNNISILVETWFTESESRKFWHYLGAHRGGGREVGEPGPEKALMFRELRDKEDNTIRLEVFQCEKTPPTEHKVYMPKELIYEWRDNNGYKGHYYMRSDVAALHKELTGENFENRL